MILCLNKGERFRKSLNKQCWDLMSAPRMQLGGTKEALCAQLWAWKINMTDFKKQIPNECINPYKYHIIQNNTLKKKKDRETTKTE